MPMIKFCGITGAEDALAAVEAGADMLGFNFYPPSPRSIQPGACQRILGVIQNVLNRPAGRVLTVGVFVNLPATEILAILDDCGLDLAQLSGDEPPEVLKALGERGFKALRQASAEISFLEAGQSYPRRLDPPAFLVDAGAVGQYGGTGQVADWGRAAIMARQAPILLAGGLKPENVFAAVRQVRPWGVDTASGIESSPGKKDFIKMRDFTRAVHEAAAEMEGR